MLNFRTPVEHYQPFSWPASSVEELFEASEVLTCIYVEHTCTWCVNHDRMEALNGTSEAITGNSEELFHIPEVIAAPCVERFGNAEVHFQWLVG